MGMNAKNIYLSPIRIVLQLSIIAMSIRAQHIIFVTVSCSGTVGPGHFLITDASSINIDYVWKGLWWFFFEEYKVGSLVSRSFSQLGYKAMSQRQHATRKKGFCIPRHSFSLLTLRSLYMLNSARFSVLRFQIEVQFSEVLSNPRQSSYV